jgi:hypothetical protein
VVTILWQAIGKSELSPSNDDFRAERSSSQNEVGFLSSGRIVANWEMANWENESINNAAANNQIIISA